MNPETEWSTREKLAIASYVLRSGEQHWSGVGRLLRPLGEPDRPGYWFSPKFCAQQYTALLENEDELPKRKRNTERSDSNESLPAPASKEELIVRRLTKERIDELKRQLRHDRAQYRKRKQELEMVEAGTLDDKLEEIWENLQKEDNLNEQDTGTDQKSEDAGQTPQILNEDTKKEVDDLEQITKDAKSVVEEIKTQVEKLAEHPKIDEGSEGLKTSEAEILSPKILSAAEDAHPSASPVAEECMETQNNEEIPVTPVVVQNQEIDSEVVKKEIEENVSFETKNASTIDAKLHNDPYVSVTKLQDAQTVLSTPMSASSIYKSEKSESTDKKTNETDTSDKLSGHNAMDSANEKLENQTSGSQESEPEYKDTGNKTDKKKTPPIENVKEDDSASSGDELNVASNTETLNKNTTVEDSADLLEENESVYNYSMDEESSSYQQQMSQPGTPLQFSCDSFPSSPALSHSSDLDPETVANCKAWRKSIMILWKQVASHRYASLFLQPVTDDIAPNYSTTVYRTMDLSTLKKNIENGVIRTTSEFQRDLMLMFQNAIMYNNREHDVYKMTMEMQKDVMDQVAQFLATQLMVETAQPASNKSLRRSTMRRSAISNDKISEARSKRVAAIEGEAKLMRKKQPSHE